MSQGSNKNTRKRARQSVKTGKQVEERSDSTSPPNKMAAVTGSQGKSDFSGEKTSYTEENELNTDRISDDIHSPRVGVEVTGGSETFAPPL